MRIWAPVSVVQLMLLSSSFVTRLPSSKAFPSLAGTKDHHRMSSMSTFLRPSLLPLHNDINPSLDGAGDGSSSFDVDSARKQLQSLFISGDAEDSDTGTIMGSTNNGKKSSDDFNICTFASQGDRYNQLADTNEGTKIGTPIPFDDSLLPPLPPLSTIERDRREAEIQLLERLGGDNGDEVMPQLWDLWYSERGGLALARLQQVDRLMGDPTSWKDCETSLLQMIDEYTIYFVEPVNRLATLYYLQGKYGESYHLCRLILLKLKPWHVGALAGMVQVCINRGDRDQARYWAVKRLPSSVAGSSFPPFDTSNGPENPRRGEWVKEMVGVAKQMLEQAERNTKKRYFGKPEKYYNEEKGRRSNNDEEEKSWEEGFQGDVWQ